MASYCSNFGNKDWIRWYVSQDALLDYRCMDMLRRYYQKGASSIKNCTSRGPGLYRKRYGVVEAISPTDTYPGICQKLNLPPEHVATVSIRLPNPSTVESFLFPERGPAKPPYRKRTRDGVYVGTHPSAPLHNAVHPYSWNPDTIIPREGTCLFEHCRLQTHKFRQRPS